MRIAAPIFFKLEQVKRVGIPVRAVPNVAYDAYFARENGISGTWIRPEDMELYEDYIEAVEFEDADLPKERALYRIYHDEKHWPGELDMLFTNFNHVGLNRLVPSTLAERRISCGQRCEEGGACRLCYRYITMANEEFMKKIKDKIDR